MTWVCRPARVCEMGMWGYGYRYKLLYPSDTHTPQAVHTVPRLVHVLTTWGKYRKYVCGGTGTDTNYCTLQIPVPLRRFTRY